MAEPAPAPRTLVVTVGTSLLTSASWKPEGPFATLLGYNRWVSPDEWLEQPASRRSLGHKTAPDLQEILRREDPGRLAAHFALDFDHPLRYSGELTTLQRLYQVEAPRVGLPDQAGVAEFLGRRYRPIELVCARNEDDEGRIAARHLQAILARGLGHPEVRLVDTLRSDYLGERLGQLRAYLRNLADERRLTRVDLLVTGGYKAYAMLAGRFVASQPWGAAWRVIYLHEADPGQLVVEGKDAGDPLEGRGDGVGWRTEINGERVRWEIPDLEDAGD